MGDGAADVLTEAAAFVQRGPLERRTAEQLVRALRDSTGADHAGLMMVHDRSVPEPAAGTGDLVLHLLGLETSLHEGPASDSAAGARAVLCNDLAAEDRWPSWAPDSVALGISSVLAVPVGYPGAGRGALTCFAARRHAFTPESVRYAELAAEHAALILATAADTRVLREQLVGRTLLGQALGVLMERLKLDSEQAFHVLVNYAFDHRMALRAVASRLVGTSAKSRSAAEAGDDVIFRDELVEIHRSAGGISVRGEIDMSNARGWRKALMGLADREPGVTMELDLTELTFIDLAGSREIVRLAQLRAPGIVRVRIPRTTALRKIAALCGWDEIESLVWKDPSG